MPPTKRFAPMTNILSPTLVDHAGGSKDKADAKPQPMTTKPKVRTCLWFESEGEAAAALYVSLLPNSHIDALVRPEPNGAAFIVEFTLAGTPYMALNGGPHYKLSPAASIVVRTDGQAETDRIWDALLADGGHAATGGWLTDRFGVSWQIIPGSVGHLLEAPDREAAGRAMQTLLGMACIDIAGVERAFRGG